jgi:hypothetical protein
MKVCVVMIGVSRPSSQRIIENIKNNMIFFRNRYPTHTFEFIVCSYINENYNDIFTYCEKSKIISYFIEPIKDSDIPKELLLTPPNNNRYRLFYSMDYIVNKINDEYDGIIRIRLDTEIKSFELFDTIKPNIYYTVIDTINSCSDNIGYARLEVMKNVWNLNNAFIKALNNEHLVYNAIMKNSYSIEQFKFHYKLYQDNSKYFDGILQWSKKNREWIYDGKKYTKGKGF